ncbi:uncharacterized protein [Amphiura filiformis]|uniref:uncharacterized protein n=1 Tax=Amphiura filiformis TaxID=82378 RepID=UPI003B2235B0
MRLINEELCYATDLEPPFDEISEVHAVDDFDEDFPEVELTALTDEEAQALAAEFEFEELDLPAVELTQEQALALIAELEAEYPSSHDIAAEIILDELPPLSDNHVQSEAIGDNDNEEREKQERLKEEEQEMIRLSRAELQRRLAEIDEELELLRIRKEKRRKEQAEYMELMVQYEQERRERQEKERLKRQEEIEKKRLEREKRQNAMNSFGFQLQFVEIERPASKCVYKTQEELSRQKEVVLSERVPPLVIDAASTEAVREIAEDLHDKLRGAVGTIFDLTEKVKKTNNELNELRSRLGSYKTHDHNQYSEPGRVITAREGFQKGVS